MRHLDVENEFYHYLSDIDHYQYDNQYTGRYLRDHFLKELHDHEIWGDDLTFLNLDLSHVRKIICP